ncbi:MAG TPA: diacylglycerol kinase family protein [Pyrinomonadaceae bacterium]|nr:diacylglycerol kinase family protein [Pyrinomonadaceae bacterium]
MNEKASLFVVINHTAARAREAWPRARAELERAGVPFEAHESTRVGETEERARAAFAEGFGAVAAVGGDGTLSAAASGYFEPCAGLSEAETPRAVNPQAALALLPAGTGDDFARGLAGGRRAPLEDWLARLVRHARPGAFDVEDYAAAYLHRLETTLQVDVMLCSLEEGARRFVCLNAATLGIGAEVATRVAAQGATVKRLPGEARFALAAVPRLAAWRNRRVRIHVDGRVWRECGTNLIAVVNGAYAGGGMNFSPQASLTDGLLDVLAVCDISRPALLRELSRVHRGGHLRNPRVKLTRARHVRVETLDPADSLALEADGDPRGHTPADIRVMPGALRVVF